MKRSIIYRIASAIGLLMAFGVAAHAETSEVTVQLGPDDVRPISVSFDYEVVVDFPTGSYTGVVVKALLPPGITRGVSGSPTSGEFDNGVYSSSDNSISWVQQVSEIDVTEGSGVRKFTIEVTIPRYTTRDGQPFTFVAKVNGERDDLEFPEAMDEQLVTGSGQGLKLELAWNSSLGYGKSAGRWGLSDEATPRPGWFSSIIVPVRNGGTGPTNPGASISVEVGAGYYIVSRSSYGMAYSDTLTPYQRGGSWTASRSTESTNFAIGHVTIGVFVPCEDFGKTEAEAAALAASYVSRGSATASGTDYAGNVTPKSIVGADIAGPNLQVVCGSGGKFETAFRGMSGAGTHFAWNTRTYPPAGVTSITDALVVNTLPAATTGFGLVSKPGYNVLGDFSRYFCNFSEFGAGHFSAAQFLERRAAKCRETWTLGDTHLVHYAAEWKADEETGLMSSFGPDFYIDVPEAYSLAHIGETLVISGYFNGTTIYGPRGDQDATNDGSDVWQHASASTAFPVDAGRLVLDGESYGAQRPTSPVDANNGTGVATWLFGNDLALRWPVNPSFNITAPPGIIITNFIFAASANCEAPVPVGAVPTAPFGSTIAFQLGTEAEPWRIAREACGGFLKVSFMVDRLYPFFDNQNVSFSVTGTADNQPDAITRLSTRYTSTRIIVTTGMDVQLEGGCWTDPVAGITPPQAGQVLYKATAINRGSDDLEAMELRFIVPPGATYQSAFAGPDFPADTVLEVSRDGGLSWHAAPGSADATITDVRIAGFGIEGAGLDALRPSFYVAVTANDPSAVITAKAWSETPTQGLGRTPEKAVAVDAAACRPACDCQDLNLNDCTTVTGECDAQGVCIQVAVEDQTSCTISGDVCVTAAQCQGGVCTATQTTTCNDEDTCTGDRCDPELGCMYDARYDCEHKRPFYFPVHSVKGEVMGALVCYVNDGKLTCDADAKGNVQLMRGQSFCQ